MDPDRTDLLERARALTEGRGHLLFLTLFGSSLYGTRRPDSDIDVRGVWLPHEAPADAAAAARQPTLTLSTGPAGERNGAGDVDVVLSPLERWICVDLAHGSVPDMDLLYAPGNAACTIFRHPAMDAVLARPGDFLGLADGGSLRRYCLGQGNNVGLEGTRLGAVWRVWKALAAMPGRDRLEAHAAGLTAAARAPEHCCLSAAGGLLLAGREHNARMRLVELTQRLARQLEGHLERIGQARENKGVRWKNLAHALRACVEQQELLRCGSLHFPFRDPSWFMDVRAGRLDFREVERRIIAALDETERLRAVSAFAREPGTGAGWAAACLVRRNAA